MRLKVKRNLVEAFIGTYVQALLDQNAAVFAGAGLSIPAGVVDWKELMRDIANDIGLDVDKEHDLITIAQFHVNERGGRHRINQALINEFSRRSRLTDNHRILASLPIRTFWTTNYDTLIEQALRDAHKNPDIKISVENLATTVQRRDAVVYKMHGDVSQPDKAVVTKDDYESYNETRQLFSTALQGDLVSKTFLFIGFSFNDPNLAYILSRIRVLLGANRREHYCLLRQVQRSDFAARRDFEYARAKQQLQVNDLRRYGIVGLLVDNYGEYTKILRQILQKYNMSRVFISGSASTYTPWGADEAQQLIQELSQKLVEKGFGVVSGFGLGVGAHVVNGVLDQLDKEGTRQLDDRIVLRPFPYSITDSKERKRKWSAYREEMLSHAGIAIFLFGNKSTAPGIALADGMKEEFDIAVKKGLAVVPIGCTGSMAETLHRRVLSNFSRYYPSHRGFKSLLKDLGKKDSPSRIVARIIDLVNKLKSNA
jgi:hypothetical protein